MIIKYDLFNQFNQKIDLKQLKQWSKTIQINAKDIDKIYISSNFDVQILKSIIQLILLAFLYFVSG